MPIFLECQPLISSSTSVWVEYGHKQRALDSGSSIRPIAHWADDQNLYSLLHADADADLQALHQSREVASISLIRLPLAENLQPPLSDQDRQSVRRAIGWLRQAAVRRDLSCTLSALQPEPES